MKPETKTSIHALVFTAGITVATLTRHASPFSYSLLAFVTILAVIVNLGALCYMAWHDIAPVLSAPAWARWGQFYVMSALIGYLAGNDETGLALAFTFIALSDLLLVKSSNH
jgi:uncharacterized membrane protein YhaH (DUF805 family)